MSENTISTLEMTCPVPLPVKDTILLGHGSGGKLSAELIQSIFLPAFKSAALEKLDDQAIVSINGTRLAFTTDSFVVKPLFFPGGDIGSLAVHGTVNDLAMGGARPLFLSAAFIIEEGLPMDVLRRVVRSLRDAAHNAGVEVVTGDTKVVERGAATSSLSTQRESGLSAQVWNCPQIERAQATRSWSADFSAITELQFFLNGRDSSLSVP